MLKFFLYISFESRINRMNGLMQILARPVRDNIWVETKKCLNHHRAVRYGICRNSDMGMKDMAYLRHAIHCLHSIFYPYVVPTGQTSTVKSQYPHKPVIQITTDIIKAHGGEFSVKSSSGSGSTFIISLKP